MAKKILLTSFDTWMSHQKSNASDDLLVLSQDALNGSVALLRKLPVYYHLAPYLAIAEIQAVRPDVVICCGMAEGRQKLTVESQATSGADAIKTPVDLQRLIAGLTATEISHDAGKFVCEATYYSVLKYLHYCQLPASCIFVHVPVLTPDNSSSIVADFVAIVRKLAGD